MRRTSKCLNCVLSIFIASKNKRGVFKSHLSIFAVAIGFLLADSTPSRAGDCNGNGIPDDQDIVDGTSADCNANGIPDDCEIGTNGFPFEINLADLDGTNGFVINGIDALDRSGLAVSSAGDVNGDGIDDLIIGAFRTNSNGQAVAVESYVVFGTTAGFAASLNLTDLDGGNGSVINGIATETFSAGGFSGSSVSGAGDVNGDGVDDLVIGAPTNAHSFQGLVGDSYVVFGTDFGFASSLNLADLDGTNGFVMFGINMGESSGYSVSSAGDVNGDGVDDLIIGAPGAYHDGRSYVVFGTDLGFAASLNLYSLDGTNGFVIKGIAGTNASDSSGSSVSDAGDVNGDGIDDLIIGAPAAVPAGESYVVFGTAAGFAASLDLADLDGTNGFVIKGIDEEDQSGISVSGAGDVNGDGIDDLIIGAHNADPNQQNLAGESYVVFGTTAGFAASLRLFSLDGTNGFVINGIDPFDNSGRSVSGAGDVNRDGIDDLIIGANGADLDGQVQAGESYVVFGTDAGFAASMNLADLDGSNGFVIKGIHARDYLSLSVSGAGDVNGDGIDDLIIGAPFADPNGQDQAGESYVVFGRAFSADCNDNGILDVCEGGCNDNGFPDDCDIAIGISEDCNGNNIPDDCDIAVSASLDCNFTGIPDECEIASGSSGDCNGNDIPDECDIVQGTSEDCNASGVPDSCEATLADAMAPPTQESHALSAKNRYLSFVSANPGLETALSITLVESEQFPEAVGATWWVASPFETCENGAERFPPCSPVPGVPSSTFLSASLQCAPHCMDWGSLGQAIQVGDINVVPGASYEVRAVPCGCDATDPTTFSDPLEISTSAWGDTISTCAECPCASSDGIVNIIDCTAVTARFVNSPCAPLKSRVDLEPAVPDRLINITDVLSCIKGFQGLEYNLSVPVGCK